MSVILLESGSTLLLESTDDLLLEDSSSTTDPDPKTLTLLDEGHTFTFRERTHSATAQENR